MDWVKINGMIDRINNMKVCLIAYALYEADIRVKRYAEALVEHGIEVDVIALKSENKGNRHKFLNGVDLYSIHIKKGTENHQFDYFLNILLFFIIGSFLLLIKHLKSRYQVIHIHNVPDFLVFMSFIPKLMGAKIILDIHDILPEFFCQKFNKPIDSYLAKLLFVVEKLSVRFANHVIVSNDLWRGRIIQRNNLSPDHCTTILNYPTKEFFNNSVHKFKNNEFKIIYPGTISYIHGIDIAINAIAIVKHQFPDVRLNIYTIPTNMKYFNYINSLIDHLQLNKNVKFYEFVPLERLRELMSTSTMGIVPKREGIFAGEAFSTKILQFMAAGIPVIASRTKIDEYYFDDSMIMFFEPNNPEDLANQIIELFKDIKKQQSLVINAKHFVLQNQWELKKDIYFKIIDRMLKKF